MALSSIMGTKIYSSPHVPRYQTKHVPPSDLDNQAGNILFRMFQAPPTFRVQKVQVTYFLGMDPAGGRDSGQVILMNPAVLAELRRSTEDSKAGIIDNPFSFFKGGIS